MPNRLSASQYAYRRAATALDLVRQMPRPKARPACYGNKDFDIVSETERVARSVLNKLAKVCNECPLRETCTFRQVARRVR